MQKLALVLVLAACAAEPAGSGVKGSRADVHTAPGRYDGYRVSYPCRGTWTDVGLEGLGTHTLTTSDDIAQAGGELLAQLRDLPSVWGGGGYGLQCGPGVGTNVFLDDWRDVDRVIGRVGQFLRTRDLALQVGISVEGIPVPDRNECSDP